MIIVGVISVGVISVGKYLLWMICDVATEMQTADKDVIAVMNISSSECNHLRNITEILNELHVYVKTSTEGSYVFSLTFLYGISVSVGQKKKKKW